MRGIVFDYHYGLEAEQYAFFRIPKILITDPIFKKLSLEAKVLYGMMMDRLVLSAKNGWKDNTGRIYIYFTIEDICKSQYKNAQKSEYKNVQGSDIYSSGCASKKDRFSLRRYDGPLIETISE